MTSRVTAGLLKPRGVVRRQRRRDLVGREAALRVGSADGNGNWPVQLTVNGLRPLPSTERYYLMVWQGGRPVAFCGGFEVSGTGPTTPLTLTGVALLTMNSEPTFLSLV